MRSNHVIKNELDVPIEISYSNQPNSTFRIASKQKHFVPIANVGQIIHYRPSTKFLWSKLDNDKKVHDGLLYCYSESDLSSILNPSPSLKSSSFSLADNQLPFHFLQKIEFEPTGQYIISIRPVLVIENLLASDLSIQFKQQEKGVFGQPVKLKRGEKVFFHKIDTIFAQNFLAFSIPGKPLFFAEYSSSVLLWCSFILIGFSSNDELNLNQAPPLFPFAMLDSDERTLNLFVETVTEQGSIHLTIFAKYWIINKTGLPLLFSEHSSLELAAGQSKIESISHYFIEKTNFPSRFKELDLTVLEEPLMFAYNSFDIFQSRMSLKAGNSNWSNVIISHSHAQYF